MMAPLNISKASIYMVGKDLLDTPVTELMTDFFAKYTKL